MALIKREILTSREVLYIKSGTRNLAHVSSSCFAKMMIPKYEFSHLKCQLKVARYSFSRSIPPKFEHKLRRHKQRFGKLPPQLYQIKMKICYDQGCNDIGVVIATK